MLETLSLGASHPYRISLARGQVLVVTVEQLGVDVVVSAVAPGRREIAAFNRPTFGWGLETLSVVADASGEYEVRVAAVSPEAPSGRYEIRAEVRPLRPADRDRFRAERMVVEGHAALEKGALAEALALFEGAAAKFSRLRERRLEAIALVRVADVRVLQLDSPRALAGFSSAARAAAEAEDRALESEALCWAAYHEAALGRPADAAKRLDRALELCPPENWPTRIATLNNMGYVSFLLGRHQRALEAYQQALPMARAAKIPRLEAWALFGFGLTYWAFNEPEKSIRSYDDALAIFRARRDLFGESVTLQSLSAVYYWSGKAVKALETVEPSIAISRLIGDRPLEALGRNNLGLAEIALGRNESALEHVRQAYAIWSEFHDPRLVFAAYSLGLALEAMGDRVAARRAWEDAVAVSRRFGNRWVEGESLAALARNELAAGALESARSHAEASVALSESIRGEVASPSLRSTFLAEKQDAYAVLVDALLAMRERDPGADYLSRAFAASERGRARGLVESMAEARIDLSVELPEDLRRREAESSARIDRLQKARSSSSVSDDDLARAEEEWEGLVGEIRKRSPRYASLTYPSPVSMERARGLLDPESALVSYSASSERVLVFVLTSDSEAVVRLKGSPWDLKERIENYVGLISQSADGRWRDLGSRLYADLVAPWRSLLPARIRRLVIIPEGALHSLTFEALPVPGSARRYLVEDFAISYAPSATVLQQLRAELTGSREPAAVLAFAAPEVATAAASAGQLDGERFDTSPLPRAASEARMVFGFGGPGSRLRSGPEASARFARTAPLDRYRVIHFATHALLSQRAPLRSALVLAAAGNGPAGPGDDGLLRAREIYGLRLTSDLVVLSACRTARGRILWGQGVQGLAQAFFHAGARSLVASLWDVSDRRTEQLMESFYRNLAGGMSKGDALTLAKRDLLRRKPDLAPRFWAAFVLLGDAKAAIPLAPPSLWRRLFG